MLSYILGTVQRSGNYHAFSYYVDRTKLVTIKGNYIPLEFVIPGIDEKNEKYCSGYVRNDKNPNKIVDKKGSITD